MGSAKDAGTVRGGRRSGAGRSLRTAWAAALGATALLALQARAGDAIVLRSIDGSDLGFDRTLAFGGDLDGDGKPEVLVEASDRVRAYSFATGAVVRDFQATGHPGFLGRGLTFLPDVDGDQVPDVLAGAPGIGNSQQPPGQAIVFSGADGSELFRGSGTMAQSRFGSQVIALGDVTGDGTPDFAAGGYGTTNATPGEIRGFSGADGSGIPWLDRVGQGTDNLGFAMAALGDVDGDGFPDFVAGSPGAYPRTTAGKPARGRIDAISGRDGRILRTLKGRTGGFGRAIADVGDVDGDGRRDFAASDLYSTVSVVSSRTWRTLRRIPAPAGASLFGDVLGARTGADVDGDGRGDLAVFAYANLRPVVYVYGTATAGLFPVARVDLPEGFFAGQFLLVPDDDGDGIADLAIVEQPAAVRIVRVVPELPSKFTFAAAFVRPDLDSALATRGSFTVKVAKGTQTVAVKCAGLPQAGEYSVHLEQAPGADTFTDVGDLTLRRGNGTLQVSGSGTPPAQLGISSLADLAGRRVQVRDAGDVLVLEALLPLPGARASSLVRLPLARGAAPAGASAALTVRSTAKTGSVSFSLTVRGVPSPTPLLLAIEDAPGSTSFADGGPFAGAKYYRNTALGQPLPGGASSYAGIAGREIRVLSGKDVLFSARLP